MSRRDTMSHGFRALTPGLLLLLAAVGCGPPRASVSGTVTFQGQPVPSGTVLFHGADGRIEHGLIGADGRYVIADAPLGPVRITVRSHAAAPSGLPYHGGPPPATPRELAPVEKEKRDGKFVRLPPRYLDPEKAGLTYTVRSGSQMHDLTVQP